jgi:hypothetical protein
VRPLAVLGLLLALVPPARAGIYSPDEPFVFEIDADGYAKPVQYAGGFDILFANLREVATAPQLPGAPMNRSRQEVLARVIVTGVKGVSALTAEELAGFTADLIRLNRYDEVLNILQPLARDRTRGGFLVFAHLARAHAGRGEWREAADQQQMAIRHTEFPASFARLSRAQLTWLKRVEREYYLPFLSHRADDARRGRVSGLREDLDALFPAAIPPKRPTDPVRFVGESGQYAAGRIAAAEKQKLPPDAIAIVQQLVLWHPQDTRLYWLLGELYNADGDVETAAKILDKITFDMGYSNPIVIEHRRVLKSAADAIGAEKAAEAAKARAEADEEKARLEQAERDYQRRFWWIVAIGVGLALILLRYQFREVVRRFRRAGRGS